MVTLLLICAAVLVGLAIVPTNGRALLAPRRHSRGTRLALPVFVEALGAALGAGLSLEMAFAEVAGTLPQPLAGCCRRASSVLRLGASLPTALASLEDCVPLADLAALRVVLGSFHRAGGPIRRRLERVARLLRGRLALEDERRALTAQGRMSAIVLIALAPFGAVLFTLLMPSYAETLLGQGRALLLAAIALELAGTLWLLRIVRSSSPSAELPGLLDAVVVGLDAGLTFEQSLRALAGRGSATPAARRLAADLGLGIGQARSLARFAACGLAEARVAGLVAAATRLGAPLAELLVTQADALRDAERRRAEERARRLPLLMLFPLTFCVLPALLIVFLGPPLLSMLG